MQAYASAEMAPAAELRLLDHHPTISGRTRQAPTGNVVFDELLAHLAEIVAAKVIDRLGRQETVADEWLDTRGASEYLGIHRDSLRRLAAERAIPAE
jgi:phosphopantothenate synthetase